MSKPTSSPFSRLQETVADGRTASVLFRRDQLRRLQETLLRRRDVLVAASVADAGYASGEAFAELYMTLRAVKQYHDELQPARQLASEYSVAYGRDAADAQTAVGIVVVVPQDHTLIFSTVVPLAAAIAAGNCVAVVLDVSRHLASVVSEILQESLSHDIYERLSARPNSVSTPNVLQVVQTGDGSPEAPRTLLSPSRALAIAIVDRTANIAEAATTLVDARLRFGGRSPYAPDVVLVNEFVLDAFLEASSQRAARLSGPKSTQVTDPNALQSVGKTRQRSLHVHAIRSLDDALEVATDLTQDSALAVYAFGDPQTCKYLLQFTPAQAGFANHVPSDLLVGPAAPKGHPLAVSTRYTTRQFAVPRPIFATTSPGSREIARILERPPSPAAVARLLKAVQVDDRAPIKLIHGYFERAALVGLITRATALLAGLGTLAFYLQKAVRRG